LVGFTAFKSGKKRWTAAILIFQKLDMAEGGKLIGDMDSEGKGIEYVSCLRVFQGPSNLLEPELCFDMYHHIGTVSCMHGE
jgi:hypothetical protein